MGPGQELKFHDVELNAVDVSAAGLITASINLIAQGVTESTRVGRKCNLMSINWRYNIELNETTDDQKTGDTLRMILYQDKQCNGATATVTGILESANYQSFNNLANKSRFRTLMDRTYTLACQAGGTSAAGVDQFGKVTVDDTFFKKCNIPIEFDSTTGAITEIRSNNIGVLLITKEAELTLDSKFRLRFSDG